MSKPDVTNRKHSCSTKGLSSQK